MKNLEQMKIYYLDRLENLRMKTEVKLKFAEINL